MTILQNIRRVCCGRPGRAVSPSRTPRRDPVLFRPTPDDVVLARVIEYSYGDFAIFAVSEADVASVQQLRAVRQAFHVERS